MDILGKIYRLRIERGWSEYQLSANSGLTQSTISSWYRKKTTPTIPSLEKVCQAYGISLSQFFLEETEEQRILTESENRLMHYLTMLDPHQAELVAELVESMSRPRE